MDRVLKQVLGIFVVSVMIMGMTHICMKNHWYKPIVSTQEAYYKYGPGSKSLSTLNDNYIIISNKSQAER